MKSNLLAIAALAGAFLLPQAAFASVEESTSLVDPSIAEVNYASPTAAHTFANTTALQSYSPIGAKAPDFADNGTFVSIYSFTTQIAEQIEVTQSSTYNGGVSPYGVKLGAWLLEDETTGAIVASGTATFNSTTGGSSFDSGILGVPGPTNYLAAGTYEIETVVNIFGVDPLMGNDVSLNTTVQVGAPIPVVSVPEPEQIALFLLGLPLVSWFARRKQAA
jgi:hypothetical protein